METQPLGEACLISDHLTLVTCLISLVCEGLIMAPLLGQTPRTVPSLILTYGILVFYPGT